MATCVETITGGGTPPELFPNTLTPLSVSALQNQVFYLRTQTAQTSVFSFTFSPVNPVVVVSITVTAFQKVGNAYVDLGSVSFGDLVGSFSKDFGVGEFYLCIRSNQSYNGTVIGQFSGFPSEARINPQAAWGSVMTVTMEDRRPPAACDEPIYFSIIDGELPPGLTMTGLGRIAGMLPNLDCLPDAQDYSPAMNWSYEDSGGRMQAWGRMWRFKIRITLGDQEDTYADEWFCVRVHNNWSYDRDNFLAQAPFKQVREIEVVERPEPLPKILCEPCPEETPEVWTPKQIEIPCPGCDNPDVVTDIQLIRVPVELAAVRPNAWVNWWIENKDRDLGCGELAAFVKRLAESPYFQALLAQAGYGTQADDPRTLIEATAFQDFLQLSASTLIDGRGTEDIDYRMLQWKNAVNQSLPTTGVAELGQAMEVTLT